MKRLSYLLLLLSFSANALVSSLVTTKAQVAEQLAKSGTQSYILNPACAYNEANITDTNNILTRVSSGGLGDLGTDCQIDAGTSGHLASWALRAYPNRLELQNCEAIGYYKGDASLYKIDVVQNSAVVATTQLTNATNGQLVSLNFPCGSDNSQLVTLEVEATSASAAAINFIWLHGGEATNIGDAAQAQQIGSAFFATTASCSWSRTNTSVGDFSSTAACPGPTVEFNTGPGVIQTTDADLPQITVNNLPAGQYQVTVTGVALPSAAAVVDYKVSDGTTTTGGGIGPQVAGARAQFVVLGNFSYSSAGNRTFKVVGAASSGNVVITNQSGNEQLKFQITRFPTASEQVFRVGAPGLETTAFTGALKGTTSGTFSNQTTTGFYQCDGGILKVNVSTVFSGTPGVASGNFAWDLPTGFTIDTTKINSSSQYIQPLGIAQFYDDNTTNRSQGTVDYFSTTQVAVLTDGGAATAWSPSAPVTVATNDRATLIFSVPVTASSPCPRTPMPLLSQAVTTDFAGTAGLQWVRLNNAANCTASPCTIADQSGFATSVTRGSAGNYTVNFSRTLSAAPACTCTAFNSGTGQATCSPSSPTTTSVIVQTNTDGTFTTAEDATFTLICTGAR